MSKKFLAILIVLSTLIFTGCASVPMASNERDSEAKKFSAPSEGNAGVYIYRNSFVGQALKKDIFIDGKKIGESANKVYFFKELPAGEHTFSTESEFSPNDLVLTLESGLNYFIEQYIKMGVFVGGANLKQVSEEEGKKQVLKTNLAQQLP